MRGTSLVLQCARGKDRLPQRHLVHSIPEKGPWQHVKSVGRGRPSVITPVQPAASAPASVRPASINQRSRIALRKPLEHPAGPVQIADCHRFDPGVWAVLEKIDHVTSLLENQRQHDGPVEGSQAVNPSPGLHSNGSFSGRPRNTQDCSSVEPFQVVSGCNLSCRILQWPILHNVHSNNLCRLQIVSETGCALDQGSILRGVVNDDNFPAYIRKFLANVHTKNPVVEHTGLMRYAHDIAENDLSWDGPSCIVVRVPYSPWFHVHQVL